METLRERLAEQKGRHQGGSKWIGTAGTSPFGAYGYNPEGVRIGQDGSRHRRAVQGVGQARVPRPGRHAGAGHPQHEGGAAPPAPLRPCRGVPTELDLPGTIHATASNAGTLDLRMQAERRNTVRVLLFLDIGGSMDDHVRVSAELFSAARSEFKHLSFFYFHNCPYERVWTDNRRRADTSMPTAEVMRTYGAEYRAIFVGDATMSPYEIAMKGGSVEHWNEEAGSVWLTRMTAHWRRAAWLNPSPVAEWQLHAVDRRWCAG